MSVHLQIKEQMNKFISVEKEYKRLDLIREEKIEEVLEKAKNEQDFSLAEVNLITEEINALSKNFGFLPMRKKVTKDMVLQYLQNQK